MGEKYPEYDGEKYEDIENTDDLDKLIDTYREKSNALLQDFNKIRDEKINQDYLDFKKRLQYAGIFKN